MAEKKKMSVAEILAAARAGNGTGSAAGKSTASPGGGEAAGEQPEAALEASAAELPKPAAKQAASKSAAAKPAASGGRPSVADIMAMARANKAGEKGGETKPAAAAKPPAEKAAAAKAAAAKPAAKPVAAQGGPQTGVQRDTASILAAARAGAKPGPVSKADATVRPAAKSPAAKSKESAKATEERVAPPRTVATLPPRPVKPAKKSADEAEDRRSFLQLALGSAMAMGFTALSVTGGLFSLGLARFLFPNVLAEPPSKFKVGFKEGFPAGKVETKFVAQYGVWVVNSEFQGQQQIYALKTVCTHLGCTPSWLEAEQKFKCPCHGSGFYKDGINFEGPAPRPLERYAVRVADDGQLEIDKSKSFQEELGQWADPDSYVTV
ncbi:MAG: Rieske 2Fe-2S domain-containing protein [Pirellulales bacterium]